MEVIVNPKSLEGRHQGVNVIQLETAVGAAMKVKNYELCVYFQGLRIIFNAKNGISQNDSQQFKNYLE